MADGSKIEWTDASWNPIRARRSGVGADGEPWERIGWHCEHATTGCEGCYAEGFNMRLGTGLPFKPGYRKDIELFLDAKTLELPLRWKKPRMIFVCSMTDLFADFVEDVWIDKMFAVMALCPQHKFQILTKRAERMQTYIAGVLADQDLGLNRFGITALALLALLNRAGSLPGWPLPNVWLGVSAERQLEADYRIPLLLQTPAAVRFVSLEPLLGPITLWDNSEGVLRGCGVIRDGATTASTPHDPPEGVDTSYPGLDWVIVGGESGREARPMQPNWARYLRDQCVAAVVPFFFKQWGEYAETDFSETLERVGKKAAGRLLDGREWNEMPSR